MQSWDFTYSGTAFAWAKLDPSGNGFAHRARLHDAQRMLNFVCSVVAADPSGSHATCAS